LRSVPTQSSIPIPPRIYGEGCVLPRRSRVVTAPRRKPAGFWHDGPLTAHLGSAVRLLCIYPETNRARPPRRSTTRLLGNKALARTSSLCSRPALYVAIGRSFSEGVRPPAGGRSFASATPDRGLTCLPL